MKRILIATMTCLAAVVLCWPSVSLAQKEKTQLDKNKVKKIMQEKLKQSQRLLEKLDLRLPIRHCLQRCGLMCFSRSQIHPPGGTLGYDAY